MTTREDDQADMWVTKEERERSDEAKIAGGLRKRNAAIADAQVEQAKAAYRKDLDAIRGAQKAREIENGDEGLALTTMERRAIRRKTALISGALVIVAAGAGVGVGVALHEPIASSLPVAGSTSGPDGDPVDVEDVSTIVTSDGAVLRVDRAFYDEMCGAGVVLTAVGPLATADEGGAPEASSALDLTTVAFEFDGTPVELVAGAECASSPNLEVSTGMAGPMVVYVDADAAPTEVSITVDGQRQTWSDPSSITVVETSAEPVPEASAPTEEPSATPSVDPSVSPSAASTPEASPTP